jgi:hypothetical protein
MAISSESVRKIKVESLFNGPFLSAPKAVRSIVEFSMHEKSYSVFGLLVH